MHPALSACLVSALNKSSNGEVTRLLEVCPHVELKSINLLTLFNLKPTQIIILRLKYFYYFLNFYLFFKDKFFKT